MGQIAQHEGQRIGQWLIGPLVGQTIRGRKALWLCQCTCGQEQVRTLSSLSTMKSCGCLLREKSSERAQTRNLHQQGDKNRNYRHGHQFGKTSPTYSAWANMMTRTCSPHRNVAYREVGVCLRWRDFRLFLADMGMRPSSQHSLSRRLDSGNYAPGNVDWGTKADQTAEQYGKRAMQLIHAYNQGFVAALETFGRTA